MSASPQQKPKQQKLERAEKKDKKGEECTKTGSSLRSRRVEWSSVFDADSAPIQHDIIALISDWLLENGYAASAMTLSDEDAVRVAQEAAKKHKVRSIQKGILAGEWGDVEKWCVKLSVPNYKTFLYQVYKQQYLEMIDRQETQRAFSFLNKRLKGLEYLKTTPDEFSNLCYLLTCKSVSESPAFKGYHGTAAGRARLVELFDCIVLVHTDPLSSSVPGIVSSATEASSGRLVKLLKQAVAYQMEFTRNHPKVQPVMQTLLHDYECAVIPSVARHVMHGHTANVKCAEFVGDAGLLILSGSSDSTGRVWVSETGECIAALHGHSSRIWDVSSSRSGTVLATASADGTCRVWDAQPTLLSNLGRYYCDGPEEEEAAQDGEYKKWSQGAPPPMLSCLRTINDHQGDVYSAQIHRDRLVSGGYDHLVHFNDIETGALVRSFQGHEHAVSSTIFNRVGNIIVSGSKDHTIKFWDVVSGVCVQTFRSHLWDVTSISIDSSGLYLLSSSKDNSIRLWDLRRSVPVKRLKGHQNTTKNFIKCAFGPGDKFVAGGSEDGCVYLWDLETEERIDVLRGHRGACYGVAWNSTASLLASCGEDNTVRTWIAKE